MSPVVAVAVAGLATAARTTLSDIDNWATEWFDAADLKEAKTLLKELSQG